MRQRHADPAKARDADRAGLRRLEEQIVTLKLEPGALLSEQALSAELGIGRTPIREALQRLAREGLVLILPRKGILVSETDPRKQLLVLEVRRELERLLAAPAPSARRCRSGRGSGRSPTAWRRRPKPTTTSPSCGSTAS